MKNSAEGQKPTEETKWNHLSVRNCAAVYDVLADLQRAGSLPEGKTPDDESLRIAGDIMNYAERVLANDQLWSSLPEEWPALSMGTIKKEELKASLSEIIEESK